jgi:glucokinase
VLLQMHGTPERWPAVGLALAGQIDRVTGNVLVAPNLGWRDVAFGDLLSERLSRPVFVANDLAAAAWGEAQAGAARNHPDAVLVFVGSGIGSGLVLGGRLYEGSGGVSGEFGHVKVRPGGRPCGCGERGCLEAYAGGHALGARAAEAIREGRESLLSFPEGLTPTAGMIDRAAAQGDLLCIELLEEAATLVGIAAANLMTVLNPGVLVLGGGVLAGSPSMRGRVEALVREQTSRSALRTLIIADAALGDDAGLVGAAHLAAPPKSIV